MARFSLSRQLAAGYSCPQRGVAAIHGLVLWDGTGRDGASTAPRRWSTRAKPQGEALQAPGSHPGIWGSTATAAPARTAALQLPQCHFPRPDGASQSNGNHKPVQGASLLPSPTALPVGRPPASPRARPRCQPGPLCPTGRGWMGRGLRGSPFFPKTFSKRVPVCSQAQSWQQEQRSHLLPPCPVTPPSLAPALPLSLSCSPSQT